MAQLPLLGGAYSARSIIANAQRCVNLYPERNRKDSPWPFTHYQRPGLALRAQDVNNLAPVRALYRASNGNGYCVIGLKVYSISAAWALTELGVLLTNSGLPPKMADNGIQIMLVDGSAFGYSINLATNAFAKIIDITGTFVGGTTVDTIDTFLIWSFINSPIFGSTLSNSILFDGLYQAAKSNYPDLLQGLIVNRHEILLIGTVKGENWYDAGNAQFPFSELPGSYIEHGTIAPYSIASADIDVYWLGQDLQGQGVVFRRRGYDTTAVSNHALVNAIQDMQRAGFSLSDALGFTYQLGQHVFYFLQFPSASQTWLYDASIDDPDFAWHQEAYTNPQTGALERHRANCGALINNEFVVGDYANGSIYALDPDTYVDEVGGASQDISLIRGFPHIMAGQFTNGQSGLADGKRIKYRRVVADIETGNAGVAGTPAKITLKYSDNRGKTFSSAPMQSLGEPGQFETQPLWQGVGMARDRVFEISYVANGPAALNGLWADGDVVEQ